MEKIECLDGGPERNDCEGAVEYRMPLSGTGRSFPRCERHWGQRLDAEELLRQRYPVHAPADFDYLDAGEYWDESDY